MINKSRHIVLPCPIIKNDTGSFFLQCFKTTEQFSSDWAPSVGGPLSTEIIGEFEPVTSAFGGAAVANCPICGAMRDFENNMIKHFTQKGQRL
jgi:hypothetical protein